MGSTAFCKSGSSCEVDIRRGLFAIACFICLFCEIAYSQPVKPSPATMRTAAPLKEGWEQVDRRLLFLTEELSSTETSLAAVIKAIRATGYQQTLKGDKAEGYRQGNELMDRKMGMPMGWEKFYGTTADKFYYHPTDRNSTYHTTTVLGQQSPKDDTAPAAGVASRQGLPVAQRPPQIDYIYRANTDAQKRAEAEVAKLGNKIDLLLERRRQLEAEQSSLWSKIAFRALASKGLSEKPLYRFDLKSAAPTDPANAERLEALRAITDFMRLNQKFTEAASGEGGAGQTEVYAQLRQSVSAARLELDGRLVRQQSLALDVGDAGTSLGKFAAVAKATADVATNIADAHRLAAEGDKADDEQRKNKFRSLLQESLVEYAECLLAGDEMVNTLAREWKVLPDVAKPVSSAPAEVPRKSDLTLSTLEAKRPAPQAAKNPVDLLKGNLADQWERPTDDIRSEPIRDRNLDKFTDPPNWVLTDGRILNSARGFNIMTKQKFKNFELHTEFSLPRDCISGVYLRGQYQVQLRDGNPGAIKNPLWSCGAIVDMIPPTSYPYNGPDRWNTLDVRLVDQRVTVKINGETVVGSRELDRPTEGALLVDKDGSGPIVLHCHRFGPGSQFRKLTVIPLP